LTLGCKGDPKDWPGQGVIDIAEGLGNELVECNLNQTCVDETNKIVTSAAYLKATASHHDVFLNCSLLVDEVVK